MKPLDDMSDIYRGSKPALVAVSRGIVIGAIAFCAVLFLARCTPGV